MINAQVRAAIGALAKTAARTYVVGPTVADATRACRALHSRGFGNTICYWNAEGDEPQDIANQYLAAIAAIGKEGVNGRVAVKAPPLRYSRELFDEILERARRSHVALHFDSLSPLAADKTFSLISSLRPKSAEIGCTLPGRWRRSLVDVYRAADLGLRVRVVKGQWPDVGTTEVDPCKGFLNVVTQLAGRVPHVSVATHDPLLARESLRRLRDSQTPCELELLFGLPVQRAITVAQAEGVPIRVYLPYGYAWLPYALDHVKRNPRVAWWVLRDLWSSTRLNLTRPGARHPRLPRDPMDRTPM